MRVIVDSELKYFTQVITAVSKARRMLAMLSNTFSKMLPGLFLPTYTVLAGSPFEYYV